MPDDCLETLVGFGVLGLPEFDCTVCARRDQDVLPIDISVDQLAYTTLKTKTRLSRSSEVMDLPCDIKATLVQYSRGPCHGRPTTLNPCPSSCRGRSFHSWDRQKGIGPSWRRCTQRREWSPTSCWTSAFWASWQLRYGTAVLGLTQPFWILSNY